MAVAEFVRVGKGRVSEHHALGVAGGAGSIIDDGNFVHIMPGDAKLFWKHPFREAEPESGIDAGMSLAQMSSSVNSSTLSEWPTSA